MKVRKQLLRRLIRLVVREQRLAFWIGFVFGTVMAVLSYKHQRSEAKTDALNTIKPYDFAYEKWLDSKGLYSLALDPDSNRYNSTHRDENSLNPNTEAFFLFDLIKVACLVMPETHDGALTIRDTWGRHCTKPFFFSHKLQNESIPIHQVAGAKSSFHVLCMALRAIFEAKEKFEWVLVTTEDTFALLENLRYMVAPKNSSDTHYMGHAMRFWGELYNWGNAGYILSRGTLETFVKEFSSEKKCKNGGKYFKNSDWYLGKHLAKLDITPVDTRDHMGRSRFNGYSFKKLLFPGAVSIFERYWRDSLYLSEDGPHCCSNFAVTFHGILSKSKMYQLEYMFQHLRPFYAGGKHGNVPPKAHGPKESFLTWEERLKEEALAKVFDPIVTTPKDLSELMKSLG